MAVFGLVSAVAGFVKVRYLIDKAVIDNMVFRMHYRITSAILFLCCIIVTANNLIGKISSFNFCRVCLFSLKSSRNPWKSSRNTIENFSYVANYLWLLSSTFMVFKVNTIIIVLVYSNIKWLKMKIYHLI